MCELGMYGPMLVDVSPFIQATSFLGDRTDLEQIQRTVEEFPTVQTLVMGFYFMLFEVLAVYEESMAS